MVIQHFPVTFSILLIWNVKQEKWYISSYCLLLESWFPPLVDVEGKLDKDQGTDVNSVEEGAFFQAGGATSGHGSPKYLILFKGPLPWVWNIEAVGKAAADSTINLIFWDFSLQNGSKSPSLILNEELRFISWRKVEMIHVLYLVPMIL